jgi:hypothetical protein
MLIYEYSNLAFNTFILVFCVTGLCTKKIPPSLALNVLISGLKYVKYALHK